MSRSRALAALLISLVAAPAGAQWRAELELSGARLRLDDRPSTGAVSLATSVGHGSARSRVELVGLATIGDMHAGTAQALASASLFGPSGGWGRWTLGANGSVFAERDEESSVSAYATARQELLLGAGGLWAGVALGGVNDRGDRFPVRSADLGLWRGSGAGQGVLSATLVDTRSAYYVPEGNGLKLVTEPATYTDAGIAARWELRRADGLRALALSAHGGARLISRGAGGGPTRKGFGGADAEVTLLPRVGLAASVGRQLADLARGTPASSYLSLGLRVSLHAPPRAASRATPAMRRDDAGTRAELRLVESSGALAIEARDARTVELSASFTGWEPVALESRDGRWLLARAVPSGTHRVLVRVNGGPWLPPANLPSADDGEGGRVGLLVVP